MMMIAILGADHWFPHVWAGVFWIRVVLMMPGKSVTGAFAGNFPCGTGSSCNRKFVSQQDGWLQSHVNSFVYFQNVAIDAGIDD